MSMMNGYHMLFWFATFSSATQNMLLDCWCWPCHPYILINKTFYNIHQNRYFKKYYNLLNKGKTCLVVNHISWSLKKKNHYTVVESLNPLVLTTLQKSYNPNVLHRPPHHKVINLFEFMWTFSLICWVYYRL